MSGKWFSIAALIALATALISATSCGDPQELVSIAIQPGTEVVGMSTTPLSQDAGFAIQLAAEGSYIHPPVSKDITSLVTWASDTPEMFTVTSGGLLTATGLACGSTIVTATVTTNHDSSGVSSSGAQVVGSMTASVTCFTGTGPTVTVNFAGNGTGTISSSPAGLDCSSTCTGSFQTGSTVTLNATANGTFSGWAGCTIESGTSCTIENLTNNVTVTATFN